GVAGRRGRFHVVAAILQREAAVRERIARARHRGIGRGRGRDHAAATATAATAATPTSSAAGYGRRTGAGAASESEHQRGDGEPRQSRWIPPHVRAFPCDFPSEQRIPPESTPPRPALDWSKRTTTLVRCGPRLGGPAGRSPHGVGALLRPAVHL